MIEIQKKLAIEINKFLVLHSLLLIESYQSVLVATLQKNFAWKIDETVLASSQKKTD